MRDGRGSSITEAMATGVLDLRHRIADGLRDRVRQQMRCVLGNPVLHAEIVAAGPFTYRAWVVRDLGACFKAHRGPCDDLADVIFQLYRVQWHQRHPGLSADAYLDTVEIVSPPSQAEVDEAWEVEIGSAESAMRQFYEGSARTRRGKDLFRAMKSQDR